MLRNSTVYGGLRPNYWPWNTFLLLFAVIFFIMFFPFLVVDLYYAYRDNTCVDVKPPPGTNIQISLSAWLQVDGYMILAFIIIFFIIAGIAYNNPEWPCVYGNWEGFHVFFIIWRMTWLIVGAVMFWKGYAPNNTCSARVGRYMYAMLIIGFVFLFVELILAFAYPRPVLYPVAVPVGTGMPQSALVRPSMMANSTPMYRPGGILY